jgi:hypothetical protein
MPVIRKLHLTNSEGRDATVQFNSVKPEKAPRKGLPAKEVTFKRYLATTREGTHEGMALRFGEDYGDELIAGDPEVNMEVVGREIGKTNAVRLSADGDILYAAPRVVEILFNPDGSERERRDPQDVFANVNDEVPIKWTKRKMPLADIVRRFAFRRTLQVKHVDGLSYDYLHAMAKSLAEEGVAVFMGGGAKGRDPLVFQMNGSPYRGFLEGRVDGSRYQLLLHLSNMELKVPQV